MVGRGEVESLKFTPLSPASRGGMATFNGVKVESLRS